MSRRRKTRPRQNRGVGRQGFRPLKSRVVFCVEGASERAYLQGLIEHRYDDVIVPVFWGGKGESSLRNLVEEVRRRSRTEDCGKSVWIVCDTDQNQVHKPMVDAWLKDDPDLHHTKGRTRTRLRRRV